MNIIILSRNSALYSTQSLYVAAKNRGHFVRILDHMYCDLKINNNKLEIFYENEKIQNYDAIILNDVLHYFAEEKQQLVLQNCVGVLNNGGIILIRDGITDFKERHDKTKMTELFSTKLLSFNKKEDTFHFFSSNDIKMFTEKNQLSYQMIEQSQKTSNVLFVLKKI